MTGVVLAALLVILEPSTPTGFAGRIDAIEMQHELLTIIGVTVGSVLTAATVGDVLELRTD